MIAALILLFYALVIILWLKGEIAKPSKTIPPEDQYIIQKALWLYGHLVEDAVYVNAGEFGNLIAEIYGLGDDETYQMYLTLMKYSGYVIK